MKKLFSLALALLLSAASISNAATATGLEILNSFALKEGVNNVPGFTRDGRKATILKAWRDNGNGNGYYIYVVTLPAKRSRRASYDVVGFPGSSVRPLWEFTADDPGTNGHWVTSVAFARGRIDGTTHTLLIRATRIWQNAVEEPAITHFAIFKLTQNDGLFGTTPEYFAFVKGFSSTGKYCNAYVAMVRELKIPLGRSYRGNRSLNGC